ncbi:MAG: hypothetical protein ACRDSE_24200 [Pseudonocardiaceae bacterium]
MPPAIDPPEAAELLTWLRHHGFGTWHLVDAERPSAIVVFREHGGWVDVVHVRGADRVEAARMPRGEATDIWRPARVSWLHVGGVVATLTALKQLIEHGTGDEPTSLDEPPRECEPRPLWVTDGELRAKKAYYPPSGYPAKEG